MNQASHIIAICYIEKDKDEQNKCSLSNEYLYITRKGKSYSFELDQVSSLVFKQKRLLFPLIVGGIVGSLFLIAGFNFLINIWVAMIVGLAGMLVFYYGWVGSKTLTITAKIKEYDIFINGATPPLEGFVAMVNDHFILGKSKNITYYLSIAEELWQDCLHKGYIDSPASGLKLDISSRTIVGRAIPINPTKVSNEINYKLDESTNKVVPYIFGRVEVAHLSLDELNS